MVISGAKIPDSTTSSSLHRVVASSYSAALTIFTGVAFFGISVFRLMSLVYAADLAQ